MLGNRHIKSKSRLRTHIVTVNGYMMLLLALIAILLFCLLLAWLQNISLTPISQEGLEQFLNLTKCNYYQFFSLSSVNCEGLYREVARDWTLLILSVVRTIALALLLSVIVVKLLSHKDIFVKRATLCLSPTPETDLETPSRDCYWEKTGGWELRCRFYNGTRLTLLGLTFNAKLRRPTVRDGDWSLRNSTLNLATPNWAVALPFVPLSIRIGLTRDDFDFKNSNDKQLRLKALQSHPFEPMVNRQTPNAKSFLVINIEGTIEESDGHLLESLWWPIDDTHGWYSQGREKPINVQPGAKPLRTGGKPQKWEGWETFEDGTIDNYVFGYGSLMADWLDKKESYIANLEGFERDWKATMDNSMKIPGYKFYESPPNEAKQDYVAFVNITAKEAATPITGVVKKLSLYELADLDRRERNYLRVDVTDRIRFYKPDNSQCPTRPYTVWTYTASAASLARYEKSKQTHNQTQPAVDEGYYDNYKKAVRQIEKRLSPQTGGNFKIEGSITIRKLVKKSIVKQPV